MPTAPSQETVKGADERTNSPFLRRVRIKGYKSIAFCDVELQPLTILVGRNAAGKSNFLDALAFLRDVMDSGLTKAVERHSGWSSLLCRTASTPTIEIEIEAGFTCGRARQRVRIENGDNISIPSPEEVPDLEGRTFVAKYLLQVAGGHKTPGIRREMLDLTDETGQVTGGFDLQRGSVEIPKKRKVKLVETPQGGTAKASQQATGGVVIGGSADVLHWRASPAWPAATKLTSEVLSSHRSDQTLLGALGYSPFLDLGDGLRWMGCYNIHPDAIRQLQKPLLGVLLKKDGSNLASVIEILKEIDPDSVQRVREYLSTIAEEVEGFDVARYGEYETVRFRLRSESEEPPLEFDAASMSDGTLRALAALMAAFQIVLPHGHLSVIGIEEPEAALHPAAVRALVAALREATGHTQVLLTTHSGDLLSTPEIDPCQVLVVRNRKGQTQIAPVDAPSREIVRKELYTLADLQRMDQLEPDRADLERQAGEQPKGGGE